MFRRWGGMGPQSVAGPGPVLFSAPRSSIRRGYFNRPLERTRAPRRRRKPGRRCGSRGRTLTSFSLAAFFLAASFLAFGAFLAFTAFLAPSLAAFLFAAFFSSAELTSELPSLTRVQCVIDFFTKNTT